MEYLSGGTLQKRISSLRLQQERFSLKSIITYAIQIAEGLSYAHKKGVTHRDIKSANVMFNEDGILKITDFGLATRRGQRHEIRESRSIEGTVGYMSPEQAEAGEVDHRTDIFSWGIVVYEMTTKELPFPGSDEATILHRTVNDPTPKLKTSREGVRDPLEDLLEDLLQEIVNKALQKRPEDRYRQMEEAIQDLYEARKLVESELLEPEMAYVLFMDVVKYSKNLTDQQLDVIQQLQENVKQTEEFRLAERQKRLLSIPTGDGMVLAFFERPLAPVRCATQLAQALRHSSELELRMGVHSGLVFRISDINTNKNVVGGGINYAQRVMDFGDAGHILLSDRVADGLLELGEWKDCVDDLGVHNDKHGFPIHLFNLCSEQFGNPEVPEKIKPLPPPPPPPPPPPAPPPRPKPRWILVLGVSVVSLFGFYFHEQIQLGLSLLVRQIHSYFASDQPQLRVSLLMRQVTNEGKLMPDEEPFRVSSENDFDGRSQIRLSVQSSQSGYFYVLNEGPLKSNGSPQYVVMFPLLRTNRGSAQVPTGQHVEMPEGGWLGFVGPKGLEKIWIVWSTKSVPELEMIKDFTTPEHEDHIDAPGVIAGVNEFLSRYLAPEPQVAEDTLTKETIIKGSGARMVYLLKLKHH